MMKQNTSAAIWWIVLTTIIGKCESLKAGLPKIQPFTFPDQVVSGKKASVTCTAIEGLPPMEFRWLKNGNPVKTDQKVYIKSYSEFSIIFLEYVDLTTSGNYTCELSSPSGRDSFTAELQVKEPPRWIKEPSDIDLRAGQNASIECESSGFPVPDVSWKKTNDHSNTKLQDVETQLKQSGKSSLSIKHASLDDAGYYFCIAQNSILTIRTRGMMIAVSVPARFEEKFIVQTVRRGETATLKCEAVGDKPLTINWSKDKAELDFKKQTRIEKFDRDLDKGLSSELIIRTADRKDGALYGCTAKNEYGTDERNVKLLVVEVPAQPLDVKVKEVWSRTASITWSAPYSGNNPITKYIIQYWRDRGGPHRLMEETIPNSQTTFLLKSLQPGTPYAVTVLAENEIGQGQPSEVLKFLTGEEEPSGPPTDVWIEAKGSSSILVTWKPPPREHWNGELRGYFIGYKVEGSSHKHNFKTVDTAMNDTHEYLLTNLMKSTKYNIVVKAYNSAGTGPASQDLVAKTLDGDVPDAPSFTIFASSESKITLRWTDPPTRNVPITGYTLHYKKEGGEWFHIPIIASSSKNRFTITGLDGSTDYRVYITASNQYGNGPPSEVSTVTTSMKGFVIGTTQTYVDISILVPVAACILAFIVIVIVIIIYVRKSKARNNLERALHGGKPFAYTGSTQRYIDIDKTRLPLEPGTPASNAASYATIPTHELLEDGGQDLKAFIPGGHSMKDRPLPSKPSSMKKKKAHVYDTAQ